jgi:O-antigen ligase
MRKVAYILSLILIFTIPWEDAFTSAVFGSITRLIGLITLGVWLVAILLTGRFRRLHIFHLLVLFFVLWNIASAFWTHSLDETTRYIKTYVQLAILSWIIWDLYTTSKALKAALQAYILGAYVAIVSTIINYIHGQEIALYSGGRYAGVGNAVELALALALGLPLAWHLATSPDNQQHNNILRLINFAFIPAASFAILLTGTRMAIFAVIPAFAFILGTSYRLKPALRLSIFVGIVSVMFFLQPFIPRSVIERLGTTGSSIAAGDLGGRVRLWKASLSTFLDHPYWGIGSGALSSDTELGAQAHNTFLSVLTEVGLTGFTLFMCILLIVSYQAVKQNKHYALLWITVLAVWTIGVFTLTWEYRKATWLFLTLIVVGANLLDEHIDHVNRSAIFDKPMPMNSIPILKA